MESPEEARMSLEKSFWKNASAVVCSLALRKDGIHDLEYLSLSLVYSRRRAAWGVEVQVFGSDWSIDPLAIEVPRFFGEPVMNELNSVEERLRYPEGQLITFDGPHCLMWPYSFDEKDMLGLMNDFAANMAPRGIPPIRFGGLTQTCKECQHVFVRAAKDPFSNHCSNCIKKLTSDNDKHDMAELAIINFITWLNDRGFKREVRVLSYRLDFFHSAANIAVEIDGPNHRGSAAIDLDNKRDRELLTALSMPTIRVTHLEIIQRYENVKSEIEILLGIRL
jgi:very-short-patch-repair endonuclease